VTTNAVNRAILTNMKQHGNIKNWRIRTSSARYEVKTGRELVYVSEKYFRPAEVEELLGDSTKARRHLG